MSGTTYLLPIGAKVGIYAVPEEGYVVTGEPLIIEEVKEDTTIDTSKLPTAEKGTPAGEGVYVFAKDGNCTIFGTGAATALPTDFDRNSISNAVVGDGIAEIRENFFKDCYFLNAVKIGKGVEKFGKKAFWFCMSLERIEIDNSEFEVASIDDAVIYRAAFDSAGKLYTIPSIKVSGYNEVLYGTDDLTDPGSWKPVEAGKTMEEAGYHFFKFVLEQEAK